MFNPFRTLKSRQLSRAQARLAFFLAPLPAGFLAQDTVLQSLGLADPIVSAGLSVVYGDEPDVPAPSQVPTRLSIDLQSPLFELDPRFISVAIDSSQVVGGHWWGAAGRVEVGRGEARTAPFDFESPELRRLASALSPAYLRIGGTEADHLYYNMSDRPTSPPSGHEFVLNANTWTQVNRFAQAVDYDLMFTVNAGPGARDEQGAWKSENAEQLVKFTRESGFDVPVWELGNEVNAYWFIHGLDQQPTGEQYARDMQRFGNLVRGYFPDAKVTGPAGFYWPIIGEPFAARLGIMEDFLRVGGDTVDAITWHFYPQQSRRCPVATRRATAEQLLFPPHLDEIGEWARQLAALRDQYAPGTEMWIGETGNAQCGGEPGVSDRYVATLWWLDQLGTAAVHGQKLMVRQTLSGGNYGLLNAETLKPTPDYYSSLLWKKLMGVRVLARETAGGQNAYLRSYAHCTPGTNGSVTLLAVNLHQHTPARLTVPAVDTSHFLSYELSAPNLDSEELWLNGQRLEAGRDAQAQLVPHPSSGPDSTSEQTFTIAPASARFVVLPNAAAPACR